MDVPRAKPSLRIFSVLVVVMFFTVGLAAGLSISKKQSQTKLSDKAVVATPTDSLSPTPYGNDRRSIKRTPPSWITVMPTRKQGERPEILAINKTFPNDIVFSFKYPKPDFCQGCYDGSGSNYEDKYYFSGEIINQAKGYDQPETEQWIIHYAVGKNFDLPYGDWAIINKDFFKETGKLEVGGTVVLQDAHDERTYAVTRLPDRTVAGVSARTYVSDWTNNTAGGRTNYAVFEKDGYTYELSVMWAVPHNEYIFDLVTSSFQFSLRPESEVYNMRSVSPTQAPETQASSPGIGSVMACGCGCCGGTAPVKKCLYRSKGDDIKKIMAEDEAFHNSPQCATAGCSTPIEYSYCD